MRPRRFTRTTTLAALTAATVALLLGAASWAAVAGAARAPDGSALRAIMRDLGRDMQVVTDGISREDWALVARTAPRLAEHPQPPLAEKMRVLGFLGNDAGAFRRHDARTKEAARALGQAAQRRDGEAVIASFATLQRSCLACHQRFRKPFVEHFHPQP